MNKTFFIVSNKMLDICQRQSDEHSWDDVSLVSVFIAKIMKLVLTLASVVPSPSLRCTYHLMLKANVLNIRQRV